MLSDYINAISPDLSTNHRPGADSFLGNGSVHKKQSIFGENHTNKICSKSLELFKYKKRGGKKGGHTIDAQGQI